MIFGSVPSNIKINTDNHSGDGFNRLRVSNPATIFDSKLMYGKVLAPFGAKN